MSPRIGVVTFPGTLDDAAAARAVRLAGGEPVALWHADADVTGVDAIVLPGGVSYGDYLRPGALAAGTPVMRAVVEAAGGETPVLGLGNGFQVLCEAGLLPGALDRNSSGLFRSGAQRLRVDATPAPWLSAAEVGREIVLPLRAGAGRYVADAAVLDELEGEGRVVLTYVGNPNGSARDIAGIADASGRVVGLMPQPEYAVEVGFATDTAPGLNAGVDGLDLFRGAVGALLAA